MNVAIVKYNAGNIQSVTFALQRIGIEPIITNDHEMLKSADKVIFPGVGEAGTAMNFLKERNLDQLIPQLKQPVFGVCLGLQLMCSHSEESNTECMNIFPVRVKKFIGNQKVPHMGWNTVSGLKSPLFKGVKEEDYLYYVHSFYAEQSPYTIASTDYILPFSAALQKDNFYALQAHPEKSAKVGEVVLKNFIEL